METKDMLVMLFTMLRLEVENEITIDDNIRVKLQNNEEIRISLQKE